MKTIYFDMDGTIADLYAVDNWLDKILLEDTTPYEQAQPLINMSKLTQLCQLLQKHGYRIGIISWTSKNAQPNFKHRIRQSKKQWLQEYFPIEFDEIHIIQYGYNKRKVAKDKQGYLFDDEEQNIKDWRSKKRDGIGINCKNNSDIIIQKLYELLNNV